MKRYIFRKPDNELDIRVIETRTNYSELLIPYGYNLVSIEKI